MYCINTKYCNIYAIYIPNALTYANITGKVCK